MIDLCQPNPCFNDGTCVKVVEGFHCVCGEHHMGTRCEAVKRYCVSENPCSIDALCEDVQDGTLLLYSHFIPLLLCSQNLGYTVKVKQSLQYEDQLFLYRLSVFPW